jgi:hypothetical protein
MTGKAVGLARMRIRTMTVACRCNLIGMSSTAIVSDQQVERLSIESLGFVQVEKKEGARREWARLMLPMR